MGIRMIEFLPMSRLLKELYVTQFGEEDCAPGHYWGPAVRDHYLLHYVLDGKGVFETGGRRYELTKGQGFLIVPGTIAFYQADRLNPWSYCWIGFNGSLAGSLLHQAGLSMKSPILDFPEDRAVRDCIREMTESRRFGPAREYRLAGLLHMLLSEFIAAHPPVEIVRRDAWSEAYVEKVKDFIQLNYAQKITVEDIAAFAGLSRSYLCSLFRKSEGTSVQGYLVQYRMRKACELMGNPEFSIGDIARSVGYGDPLLFSKMFRKVMGVSPRQYRERMTTG